VFTYIVDVVLETQNRMHKRNLRKRGPDHAENKSSKKKQLNGPVIVYKLKEEEILSDIQAMRNVSTNEKKKRAKGRLTKPVFF
jgi:hypothetical protein